MYSRHFFPSLKRRILKTPAIVLLGPRQCGKTTMCETFCKENNSTYVSLDDIVELGAARYDPVGFINSRKKPLIIDEVQRAPDLFLPIKDDIDKNRHPGRYLLTGSANPLLVPKLGDALTGRLGFCHLWPLSQGELRGVRETFVEKLFARSADWAAEYPKTPLDEVIRMISLGGFPALQNDTSDRDRQHWCDDYLYNLIQKDVNDLAKIEKFSQMPALLGGIAHRVGSTLNIEELSRICGGSSTTIRRYLTLLESLFLLYRLPPWSHNFDKRLVKSPKLYFSDTALLLRTLKLDREYLMGSLNVLGHLFENFVLMEVVKQITWADESISLSHYRLEKEKGTEVDLVLELPSRKLVGIEIKLSETLSGEDFKGLSSLQTQAGSSFHLGVLLYRGNKVVPYGSRFLAIPVSALWS